jgi:hypothetical protein
LAEVTAAQGNASRPVWIAHITLVSVTTDANVPSSTATEADSIQASFCRAMTNTFSAGGSEAISTAVERQHQAESCKRMDQELDRDHARHFPRDPIERAERHGHAEHEQRGRSGCVLEEGDGAIECDGHLDMQRCEGRAKAGRHDQRVEHDLPRHDAERVQQRAMLAIGERDQYRHDRE